MSVSWGMPSPLDWRTREGSLVNIHRFVHRENVLEVSGGVSLGRNARGGTRVRPPTSSVAGGRRSLE